LNVEGGYEEEIRRRERADRDTGVKESLGNAELVRKTNPCRGESRLFNWGTSGPKFVHWRRAERETSKGVFNPSRSSAMPYKSELGLPALPRRD